LQVTAIITAICFAAIPVSSVAHEIFSALNPCCETTVVENELNATECPSCIHVYNTKQLLKQNGLAAQKSILCPVFLFSGAAIFGAIAPDDKFHTLIGLKVRLNF
jgi:hypothetical protein